MFSVWPLRTSRSSLLSRVWCARRHSRRARAHRGCCCREKALLFADSTVGLNRRSDPFDRIGSSGATRHGREDAGGAPLMSCTAAVLTFRHQRCAQLHARLPTPVVAVFEKSVRLLGRKRMTPPTLPSFAWVRCVEPPFGTKVAFRRSGVPSEDWGIQRTIAWRSPRLSVSRADAGVAFTVYQSLTRVGLRWYADARRHPIGRARRD